MGVYKHSLYYLNNNSVNLKTILKVKIYFKTKRLRMVPPQP